MSRHLHRPHGVALCGAQPLPGQTAHAEAFAALEAGAGKAVERRRYEKRRFVCATGTGEARRRCVRPRGQLEAAAHQAAARLQTGPRRASLIAIHVPRALPDPLVLESLTRTLATTCSCEPQRPHASPTKYAHAAFDTAASKSGRHLRSTSACGENQLFQSTFAQTRRRRPMRAHPRAELGQNNGDARSRLFQACAATTSASVPTTTHKSRCLRPAHCVHPSILESRDLCLVSTAGTEAAGDPLDLTARRSPDVCAAPH